MLKSIHIFWAILLTVSVSTAAIAASPIQISATPCFDQMSSGGVFPLKVEVSNQGRSVRGSIEVQGQTFGLSSHVYDYPIDLPTGTVKQFIAYPSLEQYVTSVTLDFDGPVQVDDDVVRIGEGEYRAPNAISVGYIGDDVGLFQSLRSEPSDNSYTYDSNKTTYDDSYCKPEDAPDRATGYASLQLLVVGEGSERLSDDQWHAIKEYVTSGGSVLLLGGAGSLSYLQTPIAAQICPLRNLRQSVIGTLTLPPSTTTSFQNVSVVTGDVKPGAFIQQAQQEQPLIVSQHYGAGLVTLDAVNPVSQPIAGIDGAPEVLKTIISDSKNRLDTVAMSGWAKGQFQESGESIGATTVTTRTTSLGGTVYTYNTTLRSLNPSQSDNPFQIRLPQVNEVVIIFVAYFLLAIPITYFILKKLGRLELAWVTTPLLSILFAFVFYFFSASLYKAAFTRRTSGILTVAAGDSDAHFLGFSEIFIPHGGTYDIKIPNAESLESTSPAAGDSYSPGSLRDALRTSDTIDGVAADDLTVGNLAFRRFYFDQPVKLNGTLNANLYVAGKAIGGRVINSTTWPLSNVNLTRLIYGKWYTYNLGAIKAGQTITVNTSSSTQTDSILAFTGGKYLNGDLSGYLTATVPATSFGIQVGQDVSGPQSVALVMSVPLGIR